MKRCNKLSGNPQDHAGPINFYQELTTSEGTSFVGTCTRCGNAVMRQLAAGEPRSRQGA